MAKTKFESFKECLLKGDLDGMRKNFQNEFLEGNIDGPNSPLQDSNQKKGQFESCIDREMINTVLLKDERSLLKYLMKNASPEVKESMLENVLYHFATCNDEDSFQCLLDIEIKSPVYFENGETLITRLLKERKMRFCQKLIQSTKNIKKYINLKNKNNQTPLQVSIETESNEMVLHFTFETIELDNEDFEGRTALKQLFEMVSNNVDENRSFKLMNEIKTIIQMGGNIYHKTKNGVNIIESCSQQDAREEIESYFLKFEQKKNCKICLESKVDSVFECGHTLCFGCCEKMIRCPFCGMEPARPRRF